MIFVSSVVILLVSPIFIHCDINKPKEVEFKSVLLRKLRSLDGTAAVINSVQVNTSWSDKIADIFVKSIELFSTSRVSDNNNYSEAVPPQEKSPLIVRCFSEVLNIYKTYVYDKIWHRHPPERDVITNTDAPADFDPKDYVEIIEPKYHGKICDAKGCTADEDTETTTEEVHTTKVIVKREDVEGLREGNSCGEGMTKDDKGNCIAIDVKSQRYIFNVPNHCPFGYKSDHWGYCRPLW